jgi:hypothetical protein
MNETCGCCDGIQQVTPIPIANRPGLDALRYRVGTHASFLETMLARLSSMALRLGDLDTILQNSDDKDKLLYPLEGLTTRSPNDPAIAFLDAWALVADVLTFYQERIANEGYLRTATERRSILELARLVGYSLRPGVAACVYLAYTLEKDLDVVIQPGNRAQSIPGPGELPQSFETAEKLEARFAWNALKPRLTRPQFIRSEAGTIHARTANDNGNGAIYFQGTSTRLKTGDMLLFFTGDPTQTQLPVHNKVASVEPQTAENRTKVILQKPPQPLVPTSSNIQSLLLEDTSIDGKKQSLFRELVTQLSTPLTLQPRNTQLLERSVGQAFSTLSDIHPQMLVNLNPLLPTTLYSGLSHTDSTPPQSGQITHVLVLRTKYALFGHDLPIPEPFIVGLEATNQAVSSLATKIVALETESKEIVPHSWIVVERNDGSSTQPPTITQIGDVQTFTLGGPQSGDLELFTTRGAETTTNGTITTTTTTENEAGSTVTVTNTVATAATTTSDAIQAKVTVLTLEKEWLDHNELETLMKDRSLRGSLLSKTTVYVQSEELLLTEETIDQTLGHNTLDADRIELGVLYNGLKSGQRLIISGERADVNTSLSTASKQSVPGIRSSELVMLAAVTHDVATVKIAQPDPTNPKRTQLVDLPLPNDKKHTFLQLAKPLAYAYKRDTVTVYANVVRATHGETRDEVLGSGDGSKALQQFPLRQSPLTYVSATTPSGVDTTLQVRANDLLWHEADSLVELTPTSRNYVTETDDAQKTKVIFGNGVYGARLPTGIENVKARYRTGIGKSGNVQAKQISLLSTKPLGVKAVINPLRASGGANPESRDQVRRNVPIALLALDRLISVQDYEAFARSYAGIGKASAVSLSNGRTQLVNLTIVGLDNIPIDTTSDLYLNLLQSLQQFGDPHQPLRIDLAEVLFLVISVRVRVLPDYQFESVAQNIRTRLLDALSFDRRQLGQPAFQSEVLSAIQGTTGVDYVDLQVMGAPGQETVLQAYDAVENEEDATKQAQIFLQTLRLIDENGIPVAKDIPATLARINPSDPDKPQRTISPAQLVFLTPDIPDTLIITELT